MRRHVRHPSDLPVHVRLSKLVSHDRDYLRNISRGGLCFTSPVPIGAGATIHIEIPVAQPVFETDGVVVWCDSAENGFEVGVRFVGSLQDPRIVEEICQVENYRREIWLREGRQLSGEEAALEWMAHRPGEPQT